MGEMNEFTDQARELAASYALGVLDPDEAVAFERLLHSNPAIASEVDAFKEVAATLANAAPLAQPAPRVKEGLFARINSPAPAPVKAARRNRSLVNVLVRAGEKGWVKTPFPGVEVKRLFVDPVTGMITTLLRAAAGAIYPAHQHGGLEQLFVIDGDMIFDDHALDTGDFEASAGETMHSAIRSTEGCLALIVHSPQDKVFPT